MHLHLDAEKPVSADPRFGSAVRLPRSRPCQPVTPCQSGVATWNLDLRPQSCPLVLAASILDAAQQTVLCRAHVQRRLRVVGGLGRVRDDGSQRAFIVAATIATLSRAKP